MNGLRLAILDMYDGTPNLGMGCIKDIVTTFGEELDTSIYDVRGQSEVPELDDFDILISSGGPGSPLEGNGVWEHQFFDLIDQIWEYNQYTSGPKKQVAYICHSFQMACHHFRLGQVTERKSMSFGIFPVHQTDAALKDPILGKLPNPFYVADFRDWQLVEPDMKRFEEMGAEILALEKIRPHVPLERAIMAIRFSKEIVGFQFHPEADAPGMLRYMRTEERMIHVINTYGKAKYAQMIKDLSHPDKIELTHKTVLPTFLDQAITTLKKEAVLI